MKNLLCSLLFFVACSFVSAQNQMPSELHFNKLTVEDGLPSPNVTGVIQDSEGYIWMGTNQGLVRYDGFQIKVYKMGITNPYQVRVVSIFEDRTGQIWISLHSSNSIYKYNRNLDEFIEYNLNLEDSIENKSFLPSIIADDKKGCIWIRYYYHHKMTYNICLFDPQTKKQFWYGKQQKGQGFINASKIYNGLQDDIGQTWLISNNGLFKKNIDANDFKPAPGVDAYQKDVEFTDIFPDASNPDIIWLTNRSKNAGIWRYNHADDSLTHFVNQPGDTTSLASDTVLKIFQDNKKRLWIGTFKGISLFDPVKNSFRNYGPPKEGRKYSSGDAVELIYENKQGNFWCQSGGSLLYFDTHSRLFTRYNRDPKQPDGLLADFWFRILLVDKNDNLWVAIPEFGIQWVNLRLSAFKKYANAKGTQHHFEGGRVFGFSKARDSSVWIGSEFGLFKWLPGTDSFVVVKYWTDNTNFRPAKCVLETKNGKVWFMGGNALDAGLKVYDPKTKKTEFYWHDKLDTFSICSNKVSALFEDHVGNIWVGTLDRGVCRFDTSTKRFTRYPYIQNDTKLQTTQGQLDDNNVLNIFEDSAGTIWVGTNAGSLNRFDREKERFTSYLGVDENLLSIRSMLQIKNDLWLGTNAGGVFRFNLNTESIERFTEKNGMLQNGVPYLLKDDVGNIWACTLRGISIFNPLMHHIRNISKANGLPSSNPIYSLAVNPRLLLFGTENGFLAINPTSYRLDTIPPIVHVETLSYFISGRRSNDSTLVIDNIKQVKLEYNENRIVLNYTGIYFQNSSQVQFAYKLDGYDKDWVAAGTQRTALYTNLSPGTYVFHVKAANPDGVWSTKDESVQFTIRPPWWQTWWAYLLYALLFGAALRAYIVFRSRNLKRRNVLLEEKVTHRTEQLQQSLENLKAAQTQLIHSEKMASLGELTAGIAHEIQNPLNFVNNFSEVNKEMIAELKDEIEKGNYEEVKLIADDLEANEEKINHHGKRADAIVKGMLQHSRTSSGQKEPTDINVLCDEYLRLAYHGLRAKNKSFNADFNTDFDNSISKINVVPQDIGRVLLNLINNAFYAVNARLNESFGQEKSTLRQSQGDSYQPMVSVATKKVNDKIEITVSDNGNGIPASIKEKIFQPFFTTKPTGSGTGLGLSLSYDIIKAHGGELTLETMEGQGTSFTIRLPQANSI